MPSGSSGTLFRKESNALNSINEYMSVVIEMDEVNSSSSSSIGREENANHAFNASSKMKKSKYLFALNKDNNSQQAKLHWEALCSR
jgi:hypothetical protein